MSIICPNCRKELSESARFCKYCRTPVEAVSIVRPGSNGGVQQQPSAPLRFEGRVEERSIHRVQIAGPGSRYLANIVDGLVISAIVSPFTMLGALLVGWIPFLGLLFAYCWACLLIIAVSAIYFVKMEANGGQTVGKRVMGIRVVTEQGHPLNGSQAALRYLGRCLDGLTLGIGLLMIFWEPSRQSLHDKIGHTIVVEC